MEKPEEELVELKAAVYALFNVLPKTGLQEEAAVRELLYGPEPRPKPSSSCSNNPWYDDLWYVDTDPWYLDKGPYGR